MTRSDDIDVFAGVRRPGLGSAKPSVRVHRAGVPGGGALLLDLGAGDVLTLRDLDGGQTALLATCAR